ncbi:hypothetical protein K438DRAFT_307722 [Mycena galopus ATCC 62051]|nr:hypothetical protein K438DRAFT_307722 [Mycena galopus ATCC 62051]
MPVFSIAYGSFGDILATAQLVAKIVITLRRSGRPSRGWTETEVELKGLGNDLAHLTLNPPSDPFIAARVRQEVVRCHYIMVQFFAKIDASTGLVWRLIWAVSEERELAAFRTQVIERRTVFGVLLGLMNSGALAAVQARVNDVGDQVRHAHAVVQDRIENIGGQVSKGNAILRDIHESIAQQLAEYHAQITALISHIPHGFWMKHSSCSRRPACVSRFQSHFAPRMKS